MRISIIVFFVAISSTFAQVEEVKGRVSYENEPVPFASIKFQSNSKTFDSYSDKDGIFTVTLPYGEYTIFIKYLGLKPKKKR